MASEQYHAPRERLSRETILFHQAVVSLQEELEAMDWYRQRADDCDDAELKATLLHHMREEIEHAAMLLEWLRRANADIAETLDTYLYAEGPIVEIEEKITSGAPGGTQSYGSASIRGFTVGPMK